MAHQVLVRGPRHRKVAGDRAVSGLDARPLRLLRLLRLLNGPASSAPEPSFPRRWESTISGHRQQFPPGRNVSSKSLRLDALMVEISPESHRGTASRGVGGNCWATGSSRGHFTLEECRAPPPRGLSPGEGFAVQARSGRALSLGPRASCPLQHPGGPAAHMRAGRPRSQEPLRSAPFPGSAGSLPASTHGWALGPRAGGPPAVPGTAPLGAFPWERGHLARFDTPVGLRPTCGRAARGPRNRSARCLSLGARASCPLGHTGGPAAHVRAGRPRSQEPFRSVPFPGSAGILPAWTHRWACGPRAGGPPAVPGTVPLGAFPWERGHLARFNTPVGLRPTCGRAARGPRNRTARCLPLGARASCPLRHTGGPTAHVRAGRPRSQEPLRSVPFPGSAGILPASTHRWAYGPRAGGPPAVPGTAPLGAFPWERGHLARFDTPVGLRPTCGRAARGPRNRSATANPFIRTE